MKQGRSKKNNKRGEEENKGRIEALKRTLPERMSMRNQTANQLIACLDEQLLVATRRYS